MSRENHAQGIYELIPEQRILLAYCCTSLAFKQIAAQMGINYSAVKARRERLYHRLGVSTRAEAVMKAVKMGILPAKNIND